MESYIQNPPAMRVSADQVLSFSCERIASGVEFTYLHMYDMYSVRSMKYRSSTPTPENAKKFKINPNKRFDQRERKINAKRASSLKSMAHF